MEEKEKNRNGKKSLLPRDFDDEQGQNFIGVWQRPPRSPKKSKKTTQKGGERNA